MPSFENDAINFHLNERMKEEINSHHVCVKLFKYPKVNLACARNQNGNGGWIGHPVPGPIVEKANCIEKW